MSLIFTFGTCLDQQAAWLSVESQEVQGCTCPNIVTRFFYRHGLSIVAVGLLIVWIVGYQMLDPKTHLDAFFGNAIADWSGSVVIIRGTKFLYETGSAESRPVKGKKRFAWLDFLHRHSLLIFIVITRIGWAFLFAWMNPESKLGPGCWQHRLRMGADGRVGFLTKRLIEIGSKEGRR